MSKPPPHTFLGSPLPLPYKIHSFDDDETVVESKRNPNPIRHRATQRIISKDLLQDTRDTEDTQLHHRTDRLDPPKPIRFSKVRTPTSTALIDTISNALFQLEFMDDIDPDAFAQVRDSVERLTVRITSRATTSAPIKSHNIETSQILDSSYTSVSNNPPLSTEPNIFDELLKIQATSGNSWKPALIIKWLLVVFLIIGVFCLSSYVVSGLTYDYCYYLC